MKAPKPSRRASWTMPVFSPVRKKRTLTAKLGEISSRQKLDVVIVTENGLGGKSIRDFADDYFDYNGYGYGKGKDGILLLVDMDSRNYWMSTRGYAIDVFTDARIDYIGGCFKDDLSAKKLFRCLRHLRGINVTNS